MSYLKDKVLRCGFAFNEEKHIGLWPREKMLNVLQTCSPDFCTGIYSSNLR